MQSLLLLPSHSCKSILSYRNILNFALHISQRHFPQQSLRFQSTKPIAHKIPTNPASNAQKKPTAGNKAAPPAVNTAAKSTKLSRSERRLFQRMEIKLSEKFLTEAFQIQVAAETGAAELKQKLLQRIETTESKLKFSPRSDTQETLLTSLSEPETFKLLQTYHRARSQRLAKAKPQPKLQPKAQPKLQPQAQPQAQPKVQPKAQPKPQPKLQPQLQPKPQPKQPAKQPPKPSKSKTAKNAAPVVTKPSFDADSRVEFFRFLWNKLQSPGKFKRIAESIKLYKTGQQQRQQQLQTKVEQKAEANKKAAEKAAEKATVEPAEEAGKEVKEGEDGKNLAAKEPKEVKPASLSSLALTRLLSALCINKLTAEELERLRFLCDHITIRELQLVIETQPDSYWHNYVAFHTEKHRESKDFQKEKAETNGEIKQNRAKNTEIPHLPQAFTAQELDLLHSEGENSSKGPNFSNLTLNSANSVTLLNDLRRDWMTVLNWFNCPENPENSSQFSIYVENFPPELGFAELQLAFKGLGTVIAAEVYRSKLENRNLTEDSVISAKKSKVLNKTQDENTGISPVSAHIYFADQASVNRALSTAISLFGLSWDNYSIRVFSSQYQNVLEITNFPPNLSLSEAKQQVLALLLKKSSHFHREEHLIRRFLTKSWHFQQQISIEFSNYSMAKEAFYIINSSELEAAPGSTAIVARIRAHWPLIPVHKFIMRENEGAEKNKVENIWEKYLGQQQKQQQ
jgi:hypothetical protein